MLTPPALSRLDLDADAEGSVDPLSLAAVYERLADRVLPAVTVRMSRIRFVTAMCALARVCREFDTELVARDGVTPPWLVGEWFVVEALVRTRNELEDSKRIPGALKVGLCIRNKRPVSNASYLKTPKVFGFSGIFRRLATSLGFLTEDLELDNGGYQALRAWEVDEGLEGFVSGSDSSAGPGVSLRNRLRSAVLAGLEAGSTVARSGDFWREIASSFQPGRLGKRERKTLLETLRGDAVGGAVHKVGFGAEVVDALIDRGETIDRGTEPKFLRTLARRCSKDLALHLRAIDAYEQLCVPIDAAFDLVRHLSTAAAFGPVTADKFARHALAPRLVGRLTEACAAAANDPRLLEWEPDVRTLIGAFGEVTAPGALFDVVVERHYQAQQAKPPEGKRPWLERVGPKVSVRTPYPYPDPPRLDDLYLHDYRMGTVSRFLRDLGRVS